MKVQNDPISITITGKEPAVGNYADAQQAFGSNPRYSPDGLEVEIEKEELADAQKVDSQQLATAELEPKPAKTEESQGFDAIAAHEKVLSVIDTATRVPRDIVGGITKAIDNTMALAVGRENLDAANQWLSEEMPDLVSFTSSFEKGHAANGTASEVTQELSQFMIPFGAYMKGLKALSMAGGGTGVGAFTTGFLSDVITSGTALDPHIDRLAAMAKEYGVENKIVGWLADNENETDSEGRLKNILENAGLGIGIAAALVAVVMPLKGMWRLSKMPRPRSPSMGSPQAQRGSVDLSKKPSADELRAEANKNRFGDDFAKESPPSQFTLDGDEYYTTAGGKYKNNTPISEDELQDAYKKSIKPKAKPVDDYRIAHTAPQKEGANTLDDVSDIMPDDFYDASVSWRYYGHGGEGVKIDKETARIVSKFQGKPDANVKIYRAAPEGIDSINVGDWVTVNKNYAKDHGSRHIGDKYNIIVKTVKAKDIATDGNSIHEWGYSPQKNKIEDRMDDVIKELKSL